MSSLLTCGRPICRPFALAFAMPDRIDSLIVSSFCCHHQKENHPFGWLLESLGVRLNNAVAAD
jgi:hypothetical protein